MRRDTWVALFVVLVAVVVAVLGWRATHRHPRSVTRTETTVLVAPPATPLRDSGPKNNARGHASGQAGASDSSTSSEAPKSEPAPANRPSSSTTAPRPTTTHKRPAAPQQPTPGGQPPSPPPAQPKPPVSVTVPAPVTVCVRGVAGVNCP